MKSNFNVALKYVLIDEGGNSDDPHDHGGRTSRGITQREYDSWCSLHGKPRSDVWGASDETIKRIYQEQYWNPYCDNLPSGLDYLFFDISVNAGRTQAVRQFQKALGVNVDGMFGQVTSAAIQNQGTPDASERIKRISDVRRAFYRHLKQFPRYGRGWLSRVDHAEKGALALNSNKTFNKPSVPSISPKANENDLSRTTVSPETSGTTGMVSGGLLEILNNFKDSISSFTDIQYVKYALIAVAVASFAYAAYGFWHRSKVQKAM